VPACSGWALLLNFRNYPMVTVVDDPPLFSRADLKIGEASFDCQMAR
jgi:hypothetical protein